MRPASLTTLAKSTPQRQWPPSLVEKSDHRHHRLLRAHRTRPRGRRAAQCEYEFSPSDVDCHAIPPAGGRVHAIDGTISRFSEGTNKSFCAAKVLSCPCLKGVDTVEKVSAKKLWNSNLKRWNPGK